MVCTEGKPRQQEVADTARRLGTETRVVQPGSCQVGLSEVAHGVGETDLWWLGWVLEPRQGEGCPCEGASCVGDGEEGLPTARGRQLQQNGDTQRKSSSKKRARNGVRLGLLMGCELVALKRCEREIQTHLFGCRPLSVSGSSGTPVASSVCSFQILVSKYHSSEVLGESVDFSARVRKLRGEPGTSY